MISLPPEAEYPMKTLNDLDLLSKFNATNFSVTSDFQTGHLADSEQFKEGIHFANFGQVTIDPTCFHLLTLDSSQLFY